MYGIFLDISDWEFSFSDILVRNKDGKFLIYNDDLEAMAYMFVNNIINSDDGYGNGRTYHIDKIEVLLGE